MSGVLLADRYMSPMTEGDLDEVAAIEKIAYEFPWSRGNFGDSLRIRETTFNATPLPVYPFKFVIPLAGALVLMQGLSEMLRCIVCLRTGAWTDRLKDAEEIDVVEQQLAASEHVDAEAARAAIASAKTIDEAARQRLGGGS